MGKNILKNIVEALIFASEHPITLNRISTIVEAGRDEVKRLINELMDEYNQGDRGIALHEVADGYQMKTKPELSRWLNRLFDKRANRLSKAAVETLAIIAYKQPITRGEVEETRGVDSSGVLRTLLDKGLVKIIGRKDLPGRPSVYATTKEFLEVFGLKDISSLPSLGEIRAIEDATEDVIGEDTEDNLREGDNIEEEGGRADT